MPPRASSIVGRKNDAEILPGTSPSGGVRSSEVSCGNSHRTLGFSLNSNATWCLGRCDRAASAFPLVPGAVGVAGEDACEVEMLFSWASVLICANSVGSSSLVADAAVVSGWVGSFDKIDVVLLLLPPMFVSMSIGVGPNDSGMAPAAAASAAILAVLAMINSMTRSGAGDPPKTTGGVAGGELATASADVGVVVPVLGAVLGVETGTTGGGIGL